MAGSKTKQLRNNGSMLVFTCVGLVVLAMCLLVAYSFSGLYFVHNRLQASADEIALAGAKKLNDRDRIGQMNNMIARCRQLVYSSRDDYTNTKKDFPKIERFANQLLQESRKGATELENERKKMSTVAEDEAVQAMRDKFNSIKKTYAMSLPWLVVRTPRVVGLGLGRIDGVESNVEEFDTFEKLKQSDREQGYVATFSKLNLYKGDKNESLKDDDADLPFAVSSLPVPIGGLVSPARTLLPDAYREGTVELVPTATQIILDLRVENGIGSKTGETMKVKGTAVTTGASLQD